MIITGTTGPRALGGMELLLDAPLGGTIEYLLDAPHEETIDPLFHSTAIVTLHEVTRKDIEDHCLEG
ncbi:hypothetical protein A2U01_0076842 [Trifolium medium]|uniref:Uncharacterized protein n=1 Tax=Trifolium medium TaxID=97028 RepID=A0A392T399_9FABA|nr:hypothetical protein [Trifolium medium]